MGNDESNSKSTNNLSSASSTSGAAAMTPTAGAASHASTISLPPNRFELELEFVQSLASPAYLHYLATNGILYQSSFLDFLRYLRYWKKPQYAKYLSYPHCLYFLDLLVPPSSDPVFDTETSEGENGSNGDKGREGNNKGGSTTASTSGTDSGEAFRREMAQVQFRNFVHEQQFYSWQFRSARLYGKGSASEGGHDGVGGGAGST